MSTRSTNRSGTSMAVIAADGKLHKLDSAELDGGGVYEKFHNPANNEYSMRSIIQIGDKVLECQAVYDTPLKPDNACKTLHGQ